MLRKVRTENGIVAGIPAADPRITAFKGIPFAAPPVGELRWKAPQPAKNWEGELDCARFAPISMQGVPGIADNIYTREWHVDPQIEISEDCLYLNVWTPARAADEKLPVLVWYFGGGLQCGYPSEMEFDGERLARRGIIVVSVNYRVGAFGFLSCSELTRENPEAPANFGYLDQQAGLYWVKRNIAAFGGDPDQVTIAGQSAGAGSVMAQISCPANEGYIQGAVVMSGLIQSPYADFSPVAPRSLQESEKLGDDFLAFLGVANLYEARQIPAEKLRDLYESFTQNHPIMLGCIDNTFLPGDPVALFHAGKTLDIPVMAGNTADEFPSLLTAGSREEFEQKARERFGDAADQFLSLPQAQKKVEYPSAPTNPFAPQSGYAPVNGIETTCKSLFLQAEQNGSRQGHYYYRFMPDIPGQDNPGTFHSCDLWFWFETLAKCSRPYIGRHYDLARQMCNYFAYFVKTGDPNGPDADGTGMPKWNSYTRSCHAEMLFTGDGAKVLENKETDFVKFLVDQERQQLAD